jgi:hypothetical protein
MPGQIGKKILTNGKNNGCQQRLYPMLTESEIRRISKLETKKQARLSEVKVGGVGQPRGAGFGAFYSTVHSQNVSCKLKKNHNLEIKGYNTEISPTEFEKLVKDFFSRNWWET